MLVSAFLIRCELILCMAICACFPHCNHVQNSLSGLSWNLVCTASDSSRAGGHVVGCTYTCYVMATRDVACS